MQCQFRSFPPSRPSRLRDFEAFETFQPLPAPSMAPTSWAFKDAPSASPTSYSLWATRSLARTAERQRASPGRLGRHGATVESADEPPGGLPDRNEPPGGCRIATSLQGGCRIAASLQRGLPDRGAAFPFLPLPC